MNTLEAIEAADVHCGRCPPHGQGFNCAEAVVESLGEQGYIPIPATGREEEPVPDPYLMGHPAPDYGEEEA